LSTAIFLFLLLAVSATNSAFTKKLGGTAALLVLSISSVLWGTLLIIVSLVSIYAEGTIWRNSTYIPVVGVLAGVSAYCLVRALSGPFSIVAPVALAGPFILGPVSRRVFFEEAGMGWTSPRGGGVVLLGMAVSYVALRQAVRGDKTIESAVKWSVVSAGLAAFERFCRSPLHAGHPVWISSRDIECFHWDHVVCVLVHASSNPSNGPCSRLCTIGDLIWIQIRSRCPRLQFWRACWDLSWLCLG
jgi:hypothetical protein